MGEATATKTKRSKTDRRLTDEQRELAASYWPFAMKRAKAFRKNYPGARCDFESAVGMGLLDAAARYTPDRGTTFRSYAYMRVTCACYDALRSEAVRGFRRTSVKNEDGKYQTVLPEQPAIFSLHEKTLFSEYDGFRVTRYIDLVPDSSPGVGWEMEYRDEVEGIARKLDKKRAAVVRTHFLREDSPTMKETGQACGLSESRVSQILSQVPKLLAGKGVA